MDADCSPWYYGGLRAMLIVHTAPTGESHDIPVLIHSESTWFKPLTIIRMHKSSEMSKCYLIVELLLYRTRMI